MGYGGLMLVADDGHVTTLAVDPAWHRHKLGTRLLHTLATAAIHRGAKNLTLEVRTSNHAAQALYRAFGFAPGRDPQGLLRRDQGGRHRDVGQRRRHARATRDRLDELAAGVPGRTIVEALDR